MDAFYASVEQRDHPELRGKPVIVGGDRKGRGVVSAASYEARRFGVHSAMPAAQAYRLCPQGIFLWPDFQRYEEASCRIMEVLRAFTPIVEPLSLDEAFLDVRGSERLFGDAEKIGHAIKARIKDDVGLVASVGIGGSKFIAKVASDHDKPDGFCVVIPGTEAEFLAPMKVETIFGIGPKTAERLHDLGIRTVRDLAARPRDDIEARMGASLVYVHDLALGLDPRPVRADRSDRSHGKERTFEKDLVDRDAIRRFLLECAHEIGFELQGKELVGRTVTLKVRYHDFKTITRSKTLEVPTCSGGRIFATAWDLFRAVPRGAMRLLGISMHGLKNALEVTVQPTLFDTAGDTDPSRRERLEASWHEIRLRFGRDALRPSSLLGKEFPRGSTRGAPGRE